MRKSFLGVVAALSLVTASAAQAQVNQTFGAGSAVTTVTWSASFESQNALTSNPYLEGGLTFTRTNLSFNNNGCGFAGCQGQAAIPTGTGNYMYGTGNGGYFSIFAPTGLQFSGLELMYGNGFFASNLNSLSWSAYLGGNFVSSGALGAPIAANTILGFSGAFDELRYTDQGSSGFNAPAFDEVRAEAGTTVPEPSTWLLMAAGLAMVAGAARRKRNA